MADSDSDTDSQFDFHAFANECNLNKKTRDSLIAKAKQTREALVCLTPAEINKLKLPRNQVNSLSMGIKLLQLETREALQAASNQVTQAANNQAERGTSNLTMLLNAASNDEDQVKTGGPYALGFDPRAVLVLKSRNNKAVHITEFLPEHVKRRRTPKNYRVTQSASNDVQFTTEQETTYAGISVDEWGAANMRLLNYLLSSEKMKYRDVDYYHAYTTQIFDFAGRYSWASVLAFDQQYREMQAQNGFPWGTFAPQLELLLLQPKASAAPGTSRPYDATEECKMFKARGSCPFGQRCKYRHGRRADDKPEAAAGPKNG